MVLCFRFALQKLSILPKKFTGKMKYSTCYRQYFIKTIDGKRYTAGHDKLKVLSLINRLNEAHRPNVEQGDSNEIYVCWNLHDKGEKCDFVREI
jgi:hypothetical protein